MNAESSRGTPEKGQKECSPTLADLREAVTTLEDIERISRRVFGVAHPLTTDIERALQQSREALRAREPS